MKGNFRNEHVLILQRLSKSKWMCAVIFVKFLVKCKIVVYSIASLKARVLKTDKFVCFRLLYLTALVKSLNVAFIIY